MENEKRLIDANKLSEHKFQLTPTQYRMGWNDAIDEVIENTPTVDAVKVVHGRWKECDWVKYDGHSECVRYPKAAWYCSNCRNAFKKELLWKDNYCPNCGAKMDGDVNA